MRKYSCMQRNASRRLLLRYIFEHFTPFLLLKKNKLRKIEYFIYCKIRSFPVLTREFIIKFVFLLLKSDDKKLRKLHRDWLHWFETFIQCFTVTAYNFHICKFSNVWNFYVHCISHFDLYLLHYSILNLL